METSPIVMKAVIPSEEDHVIARPRSREILTALSLLLVGGLIGITVDQLANRSAKKNLRSSGLGQDAEPPKTNVVYYYADDDTVEDPISLSIIDNTTFMLSNHKALELGIDDFDSNDLKLQRVDNANEMNSQSRDFHAVTPDESKDDESSDMPLLPLFNLMQRQGDESSAETNELEPESEDIYSADSESIDEDPSNLPLPPLSDLIEDKKVKADVSWLLDFAVIGNAKSGTTFLKNYLGKFDEIYMDPSETCKNSKNRTDKVVQFFHERLQKTSGERRAAYTDDGRRVKTGLKCPKETGTQYALGNYATYFPRTKFIVTVRHPVLWFQSFYNYRTYNAYPSQMVHPRELIGQCVAGSPYTCPHTCGRIRTSNVCTNRANYHHQLSRLGKTPMHEKELKLLNHNMTIVPGENKIFLAELGQFIPENPSSDFIAEDLSKFLGLQKELPSLQEFGGHKRSYPDDEKRTYFMNICDDEHQELRQILVDIGKEAAEWITEYFILSPDVVVSSKELFVELIKKWGEDPCTDTDSRQLEQLSSMM